MSDKNNSHVRVAPNAPAAGGDRTTKSLDAGEPAKNTWARVIHRTQSAPDAGTGKHYSMAEVVEMVVKMKRMAVHAHSLYGSSRLNYMRNPVVRRRASAQVDERTPLLAGKPAPLAIPSGAELSFWGRLCSPESLFARVAVIILACALVIASAHEYDMVGAVEKDLEAQLHVGPDRFSWFYSWYSIPNMFLVLINGMLIDKIGLRLATLIFATFVGAGGVIFAMATAAGSFTGALAGRMVYALGSETMYVAQNSLLGHWFPGNSVMMGMGTMAIRLGSYLAFTGSSVALRAAGGSVLGPVWLGAGSCLLCLLGAILYFGLDYLAEKSANNGTTPSHDPEEPAGSLLDSLRLPARYWVSVTCAVVMYSAYCPFQSFSTEFLQVAYRMTAEEAQWTVSLLPLTSLALSIPVGLAVDKFERHVPIVIGCCLAAIPLFYVPIFCPSVPPAPVYAAMGLLFTVFPSAIWPAITLTIPPKKLGAAFGMSSALINLALFCSYQAVGAIDDITGRPGDASFYYCGLSLVGALCALAWVLLPAAPAPEEHSARATPAA
eukprot:tig00020684_g12912.t1